MLFPWEYHPAGFFERLSQARICAREGWNNFTSGTGGRNENDEIHCIGRTGAWRSIHVGLRPEALKQRGLLPHFSQQRVALLEDRRRRL